MTIRTPYFLFLGNAADPLAAKVAQGIRDWRPEYCIGQWRLDGCHADLGLIDMTPTEAYAEGAKTMVVGVANRGGIIEPSWIAALVEGMEAGFDLAAGLHNKLADVPELAAAAKRLGRAIHDVRHPTRSYPVASGAKRPGKRLLAVGTDCSCGKMYTTLAIEKELRQRGVDADFRATGQTGILVTGEGVAIDAVAADFISGAVETHAPANVADHWDVIEGQGSLFHPSFAGVSLGLIHGSQPDALVLCHEPTRTHMRGLPDFGLPTIRECIEANLQAAYLTNSNARFVGIAVNTSALRDAEATAWLAKTEQEYGLPSVDPFRTGVGPIVDALC